VDSTAFDEVIPDVKTTVRTFPKTNTSSTSTPAELIAFSQQLIHTEKSTEYETFELTLKGDMFTEIFYCAFDFCTRRFIVKLATASQVEKRVSRKTISSARICSKMATALCAYAEQFEASSLHVAVPKGHREYAAWMRSCLYVGLKLTNGAKTKQMFNNTSVVLLSLKFKTVERKNVDNVSVGSDSTCEGWSPSNSCAVSDISSEFYLDLSA